MIFPSTLIRTLNETLPEHIIAYQSYLPDYAGLEVAFYNTQTKETLTHTISQLDIMVKGEYDILKECLQKVKNNWDTPLHRVMK